MKKVIAFLLSAVMILSLAACSKSAPKKEKAPAKEGYEKIIDAMTDAAKNPTLDNVMYTVGGDFCSKDLVTIIKAVSDLSGGELDVDELIQSYVDDEGAAEKVSAKIADKTKMDAKELKEYQEKLPELRDSFASLQDSMATITEASDEDLEAAAETLGMTKDELKDAAERTTKAVNALCEKLDSAEISEAYILNVDVEKDGETETKEMRVFNVDGKWFSEVLFEIGF